MSDLTSLSTAEFWGFISIVVFLGYLLGISTMFMVKRAMGWGAVSHQHATNLVLHVQHHARGEG